MGQKFSEMLKGKLRDPIWQFIGALIALAGLFLPFILNSSTGQSTSSVSSPSTEKVMIYPTTRKALLNFPKVLSPRTRLLIDGKEEQDVRLFIYFVQYKGNHPLRKADFESPIHATLPKNRKILVVQKASDTEGPYRVAEKSGSVVMETQPPIDFEITQIDQQNFEIKPLLMNPNEWFKVEIYTASRNSDPKAPKSPPTGGEPVADDQYSIASEINWSCRIAGIACPARFEFELDNIPLSEGPWFLEYEIYHRGWSIYFIVLFTIINMIMILILAKNSKAVQAITLKEVFVLSFAVISTMSVSEILADWLFNDHPLSTQPIIARVQLAVHICLFIALALPILVRRYKAPATNA